MTGDTGILGGLLTRNEDGKDVAVYTANGGLENCSSGV
jgi:hypothetical protein